MILNSGDTDGVRASESRHAVEHSRTNRNLGCLGVNFARPQARTGERLEPVHQVLHQRAPVVAASLLPFAPAGLGNGVDGSVAPCRAGRGFRPRTCTFARWNRGPRTALGNRRMTLLAVVRAVPADDVHGYVGRQLVEQVGQHVSVAHILVGHQRRAYLACFRVHRKMDLAPGATLGPAVLAHLPLTFTEHFQAGAVEQHVHWFAGVQRRQDDLQVLCSTAQRRVVGNRQLRIGKPAQAHGKALQCAQRQVKDLLQTEQALNQSVRVDQRVAALAGLRSRCLAHTLVDPHRDISSGDQPCVVLCPVLDAIRGLGLGLLVGVPAHVPGKNRESTQEPGLFTALPYSSSQIVRDGLLDDFMAFAFQAGQFEQGIVEYEKHLVPKVPSLKKALKPRDFAYALCLHRAGRHIFDEPDLLSSGRKMLQAHLQETWLGRGQYLRAATWLKIVYWHHAPSMTPLQTVLKAYDDMPKVPRPDFVPVV